MSKDNTLNVLLYNKKIGTIILTPTGHNIFTFSNDYINDQNRPILGLSFKDKMGEIITDIRPTRLQLPPFFSNLLPEEHLREYLAKRAKVSVKREFFLLWALGKDLPGAITIEPEDKESWPDFTENESDQTHKNALRFSLAGIQLKFSAIAKPHGGLTIPALGIGGSFIIKLPSLRFARIPENEYSMMLLAKELKMDVPEIELVELNKIDNLPKDLGPLAGPALKIRRFDRSDKGPIHIEDFSQVFATYPENKYETGSYKNIAEVIGKETETKDIEEFIRRIVFNTLIGNADMHLKNWSLIYLNPRKPSLAPAYDFVSTIPFITDNSMALKYVKTKNMHELSLAMLTYFANKSKLPEDLVLITAKNTVKDFLSLWHSGVKNLPLDSRTISIIENHFKEITLVKEIKSY